MKPSRTDGDERMARELATLGMDAALRYAATIEDAAALRAARRAESELSNRHLVLRAIDCQLARVRTGRA